MSKNIVFFSCFMFSWTHSHIYYSLEWMCLFHNANLMNSFSVIEPSKHFRKPCSLMKHLICLYMYQWFVPKVFPMSYSSLSITLGLQPAVPHKDFKWLHRVCLVCKNLFNLQEPLSWLWGKLFPFIPNCNPHPLIEGTVLCHFQGTFFLSKQVFFRLMFHMKMSLIRMKMKVQVKHFYNIWYYRYHFVKPFTCLPSK